MIIPLAGRLPLSLNQLLMASDPSSSFFLIPEQGYHTFLYGGARGVVVIAVGNEHGDTSSNPGRY